MAVDGFSVEPDLFFPIHKLTFLMDFFRKEIQFNAILNLNAFFVTQMNYFFWIEWKKKAFEMRVCALS